MYTVYLHTEYLHTVSNYSDILAVAYYNDGIYVSGGIRKKNVMKDVSCYNILKKEWGHVAKLTTQRRWHAAVVMRACLYVAGGGDGSNSKD